MENAEKKEVVEMIKLYMNHLTERELRLVQAFIVGLMKGR